MWSELLSQPVESAGDIPGWVWGVASAIVTGITTVLSGKLVVPTFAYNRERDRADKLEADNMSLHASIKDSVVPAIVRNTDLVEQQSAELQRLRAELAAREALDAKPMPARRRT